MFRAEIDYSHIVLFDGDEELVYWDRAEWCEDSDLTPNIAVAITIGYTQGADAIRALLSKTPSEND